MLFASCHMVTFHQLPVTSDSKWDQERGVHCTVPGTPPPPSLFMGWLCDFGFQFFLWAHKHTIWNSDSNSSFYLMIYHAARIWKQWCRASCYSDFIFSEVACALFLFKAETIRAATRAFENNKIMYNTLRGFLDILLIQRVLWYKSLKWIDYQLGEGAK